MKQLFKFNFCSPWRIPEASLREYFGEKLTLFIKFISFYITMTIPIAILGIPVTIVQSMDLLLNNPIPQAAISYFFGYAIIIWTNVFSLLWERKEISFALKYAQFDDDDDPEVRTSFRGKNVRSVINDQMNDT